MCARLSLPFQRRRRPRPRAVVAVAEVEGVCLAETWMVLTFDPPWPVDLAVGPTRC